jgi:hypothetical protein
MKQMLAAFAVLCVAGCTTLVYEAKYDIDLSAVTRRESSSEVKSFPAVRGHVFEDDFIKVTWTPFEKQLGLILVNKTNSSESVLWDQVSYEGPDGKPGRVIHEGVDAANRDAPMPPSVVAPGATLLDLIEPIAHLSAVTGQKSDRPLIPFASGTSEGEVRSRMARGTIKVLLPIVTNGTTREYLFRLSVKGTVFVAGWSS